MLLKSENVTLVKKLTHPVVPPLSVSQITRTTAVTFCVPGDNCTSTISPKPSHTSVGGGGVRSALSRKETEAQRLMVACPDLLIMLLVLSC